MHMTRTHWHFCGDASLEYGGTFIDLSTWDDGYCSAVRVTDLDGGCGFTGAVLIEHVVINGTRDAKRIREALRSCGCSARGMSKQQARHMIADALCSYGHTDPDEGWDGYGYCSKSHTELVQCESDGPMCFDGWKADKRLRGTTLEAYVQSVHLED
jgi:hypothetical protein